MFDAQRFEIVGKEFQFDQLCPFFISDCRGCFSKIILKTRGRIRAFKQLYAYYLNCLNSPTSDVCREVNKKRCDIFVIFQLGVRIMVNHRTHYFPVKQVTVLFVYINARNFCFTATRRFHNITTC